MSDIKVTDHRLREVAVQPAGTPADLLRIAVTQGADMEKLEKLMALQERWESNEARKAYAAAMAAFKAEDLKITKNKSVEAGTGRHYKYATLDNVVEIVGAALSKHGLMHTWRTEQDNGSIRVTCIITHEKGHFESTSLESPPDVSGGKQAIQGIGSTTSYLMRYTLMAACGVAAGLPDNNGQKIEDVITEGQQADLVALIEETKANLKVFLQYFKVESLATMPASKYGQAVKMLEAKRKLV